MTAGTGVLHSEFSSPTEKTHLLQIWILPEKNRLEPGYEQKAFARDEKRGKLRLVASKGGDDGSVHINQDVKLYASVLGEGKSVTHEIAAGRHAWVQVVRGGVTVNGQSLGAGDGAALSDEPTVECVATDASEILLFDLA